MLMPGEQLGEMMRYCYTCLSRRAVNLKLELVVGCMKQCNKTYVHCSETMKTFVAHLRS